MSIQSAIQTEAQRLSLQLICDDNDIIVTDDALHAAITERVVELLSKNPERLMSVLYRIDVREESVTDVMNNAPVGGIAPRIASLIIKRMTEKILTRRAYEEKKSPGSASAAP